MNPILIGGAALLALMAFSKGNTGGSSSGPGATLQGTYYTHSQLLGMGYTFQNINGRWGYVPPQQSQQLAATTPGTPQWQQVVSTILNTGTALFTTGVQTYQQIQTAISIQSANSATIQKVQTFINTRLPMMMTPIAVNGVWDAATRAAAQQVFGQDISNKTYTQIQSLAAGLNPPGTIAGVYGIQTRPSSSSKFVCLDNTYSNSPTSRGACTKHGGIKYHYKHSINGDIYDVDGVMYIV